MTELGQRIAAQIAREGPLSLADYMALCLMDPTHGYYATRDPLGGAGDFVTAPEISQMFGELIGLCLAQTWMDQGAPDRFTLAELGPGRGTLMADALRATRAVPGFHDALSVHLVEASQTLKTRQAEALAGSGRSPHWHDGVESLPDAPLYLIANEFFDALPVHQYHRTKAGWREVLVALNSQDQLAPTLGPELPLTLIAGRAEDTRDGDVVELSPAARGVAVEIGRRIEAFGGAALIIDYGDWRSLGETFQAVADHQTTDPFAQPGAADLTTHVDFEALAIASGTGHSRLTPQGVFLQRLGIGPRAERLAGGLSGAALANHKAAFHRLTAPSEMGTLFKVMGLMPKGAPPPPGLET